MPETVGQRLRTARESQKLTLEKAAGATRLRVHHLQALESDDYSVMASAAQGRGFLRLYAEFLGLHLDQMIKDASVPATLAPMPTLAPEPTPLSAPVADKVVEPILATPNADSSRPGFWSRLMRRGAAEPAPADDATLIVTTQQPAKIVEPIVSVQPVDDATLIVATQQPAKIVKPIVSAQPSDPEAVTLRKPRAPRAKKIVESNEAGIESDSAKKKLNLNP